MRQVPGRKNHIMAVVEIRFHQKIPANRERVWDFISSPGNLKHITPEYMGFEVLTDNGNEKMYPGMMIRYKVSPLPGYRVSWCTEITHVSEGNYFVDEQREGPYAIWHHQHHLRDIDGGVLMTDIIHYKIPFGLLGRLANVLFVKRQLDRIFSYRLKKIEEMFGKM